MAIISLKYSTTADSRPDPSLLVEGEVAINTNTTGSGVFYAADSGALLKVGAAEVSATAPNSTPAGFAGNSVGELWLDTTTNNLTIWSGSAWLPAAPAATPTALGTLYGNTTNTTITNLGYNAGGSGTGAEITAIGVNAGCSLTTGCRSAFIGTCAGSSVTTGSSNVLIGFCSGFSLTTGGCNVAIGVNAGSKLVGNFSTTIIGANAGCCLASGSGNTLVGSSAGRVLTSGTSNTFLGTGAAFSATTGFCNVAVGDSAGTRITTGNNNVVLGNAAGQGISSGAFNIAIGGDSLRTPSGAIGCDNIAIGRFSLACTTGDTNIGIGYFAAAANTTGICNVALGICAMVSGANTGGCNVAIGGRSLSSATGTQNVAIGHCAGVGLSTGDKNVFIGPGVLPFSTTGSCQLVIGFSGGTAYWICGDSNRNVRIGGSLVDNLGCTGNNGQVLVSCLSGIRWASAASGTVTSITAGTGLSGGTITTSGTLSLNTACVIAPTAFTGKGVLLTASAASSPTALTVGTNGQFLAANSACTGGLEWSTITQCPGTVTSVVAGTGLTGGTITGSGTVALNTACVINPTVLTAKGSVLAASAASTPAEVAVGTDGQVLTACSTCTAGLTWTPACTGTVTNVTGTSPVSVATGTSTPVISVATASTTAIGVTQLVDNTTTNDATKALTSAQGYALQQQLNSLSSAGGLILAATLDAATGLALTVTSAGSAAGFTVGGALPSPAAGNNNLFVIVTTGGTYTPPGGSTPYVTSQGDWFLSNGTAWSFLNVGVDVAYATTTVAGTICLATNAQVVTGTATNLAVAPAGLAAAYIANSAITAKGDLISGSAASTPTALAVGTNGQFLSANSACASGLEWITGCSGTVTSVVAGTGLTGGTITGSGTIALDTACAINPSVLSAKGTLVTASAASTPSGLAVGTNGQYLAANSACADGLEWVTSAGSPAATPTVAGILKGKDADGSLSSYLGFDSGKCVTSGTFNVLHGYCVAPALTSGGFNTAVGSGALLSSTTGSCNIAVGYAATALTTGVGNTIVGHQAGASTTTGGRNTFIGQESGISTTGQFNVALGACSLYTPSGLGTGSCNVAIGYCVSLPSLTGSCQLVLGFANGCHWLTGCSDKSIQPGGGLRDCTGSLGTAGQVLSSTAGGLCWIAAGGGGGGTVTSITAGAGLTGGTITTSGTVALDAACVIAPSLLTGSGSLITASGTSTPAELTVGSDGQVLTVNSACTGGLAWATAGAGAAATSTTLGTVYGCTQGAASCYNTGLGIYTLGSLTTGSYNAAIGIATLSSNTTGCNNTGIGNTALYYNTLGDFNTGVGAGAVSANTIATCNTGLGHQSLRFTTTGGSNTGVGSKSLCSNTTGVCNTAVGICSLESVTTGFCNTAIGAGAGSTLTTGSRNVLIGTGVQPASITGCCQLVIGFGATCTWLTGCSTKAIKPSAGIIDCADSTGTAGQVLMSNGSNAICWGTAGGGGGSPATPIAEGTLYGFSQIGCYNTAVGYKASASCTASSNTAVGFCALTTSTLSGSNTAVGVWSMKSTTTGSGNTAVGDYSLAYNTTGGCNTAIGLIALQNASTGCQNTAVGFKALSCGCTFVGNTAVGFCALERASSGPNTAVGANSLANITTGTHNVAVGSCASQCSLTGFGNVSVGSLALQCGTGVYNTAIGYCSQNLANAIGADENTTVGAMSMPVMTNAYQNTAVGTLSLFAATSAMGNVAVGHRTLCKITTGCCNVAIGAMAGPSLTTGCLNVLVGPIAGYNITTGLENVILGCGAGFGITTGCSNFAVGCNTYCCGSGATPGAGSHNIAIGKLALRIGTASSNNIALGQCAGAAITTGGSNIVIGACSGTNIGVCFDNIVLGVCAGRGIAGGANIAIGAGTLGSAMTNVDNIAIGRNALSTATNTNNIGIGYAAGGGITSGYYNVALGTFALCVAANTAIYNVALGPASLCLSKGSCNIGIGYAAGNTLTTGTKNIIIGTGAISSSATANNEVTIYNGTNLARFAGSATSWSFVSDARDKTNVQDLPLGLDFAKALQPRKFDWDMRHTDEDRGKTASGFIAQEVLAVTEQFNADYTGLVDTNNPEQFTLSATALIPVLVNAIKELSAKVDSLEQKLSAQS